MREIRSYRRVFDLERRIYSVDGLRLNPAGVPVRGVIYVLVLLASSLVLARVPVLGEITGWLPWYLRDLALPGLSAAALSVIRVEGRSFHLAAFAFARYALTPRSLVGIRAAMPVGYIWRPAEIVFLPDGSDARLRALRYTGPGAVLVCVAHRRCGRASECGSQGLARPSRRAALRLEQARDGRPLDVGQVIALAAGARLLVQPAKRTSVQK